MSSPATKTTLMIGLAEQIRQDPDLLTASKKAIDYLEELLDTPDWQVDRREMIWGCSTNTPPDISVNLSEWDRYGHRQALLMTTPAHLFDPVSRDVSMGRLVSQLLRQKYFQIGTVIDRGIKELEREEQRNGHAD